MFSNLMTIMLMMMILMLLFNLMMLINFKMKYNYNKSSPFECGFDPFNKARIPFSLNFYLIGIIFLIFDIEISIILPMIMNFKISNLMNMNLLFITFLFFMIFSLFYEWKFGSLNWKL